MCDDGIFVTCARQQRARRLSSLQRVPLVWVLVCLSALSCQSAADDEPPASSPSVEAAPDLAAASDGVANVAPAPPAQDEVIAPKSPPLSILDADGERVLGLWSAATGGELVDARDQLLARYVVEGDRVIMRDHRGRPLGAVTTSGSKYRLEDVSGRVRYAFSRSPDGDYKLKDGGGRLLLKFKAKDYGYKVVDAVDVLQFKVREKSGRMVVRDASGVTRFSTERTVPQLNLAVAAADALTLPERAALLLRLQQTGAR